jgi:hydrogenase small subunit
METCSDGSVAEILARRGVSRRDFLKFCALMTGTLALPATFTSQIARALGAAKRPPVVWLEMQDCAGCTESLLRASQPTVGQLVLDVLSLNYHETIMAPSGHQAEKSLMDTLAAGGYITVVEGAIPTGEESVYCCIGGRSGEDILKEVGGGATAVITVGACAFYGGWPATSPNPTGAKGVRDVLSGVPVINLPGCPPNVDNITATIVHYLTFGELPEVDDLGRPLFGYGDLIHNNCERRGHFDAGEFVQEWGDKGHREGWCLYQMGCKGPVASHNCPAIRWNEGSGWPVGAGHGCIACAGPDFWERAAYETVPIFDVTPPSSYPAVEAAASLAPGASGAVAAAVLSGRSAAAMAGSGEASNASWEEDGSV